MQALLAIAFAIVAALQFSAAASALTIELKDAAPDRIERQRRAARGALPLPGTPKVAETVARLRKLDLTEGAPVLLRIFKEDSELELWMLKGEQYVHFATYPICHWSGTLGPKLAEGDKQAPEGFYTITRRQIHRSGRWPRSLNLGFPNAFDRSHLRTGSYILIHGGCSSVGCYAMTNPVISEVYRLVNRALRAGQRYVPVHVFPFRMTERNLDRHKGSEWINFWRNLKAGYDSFERNNLPPRISVCNGRYQIRDASPSEVGLSSSPLIKCGQTAQILQAEPQLQELASLPSRSSMPSAAESHRIGLLRTPPKKAVNRRQKALAPASSFTGVGKTSWRSRIAAPPVTVECNIRLASCRKHRALKLKRRRQAWTYAAIMRPIPPLPPRR